MDFVSGLGQIDPNRLNLILRAKDQLQVARYPADQTERMLIALSSLAERGDPLPATYGSKMYGFTGDMDVLKKENRKFNWANLSAPLPPTSKTFTKKDFTSKTKRLRRGEDASIWSVELNGQPRILRTILPEKPRAGLGTIRKTWVAARLNELMGLTTVPKAEFARVEGEKVLLSEFIDGRRYNFEDHEVDPFSLADLRGFEFLCGNTDASDDNIMVTSSGALKAFDHDAAFIVGVPSHSEMYKAGSRLPERYTRRFIESLKSLTRDQLVREFSIYLTPNEIDSVMLRREILLKDFDARGDSAILYE